MSRYLIPISVLFLVPTVVLAHFGGGMTDLFANADAKHDGRLGRAEFIAARNANFARLDRNGDGAVSTPDFPRIARLPSARAKIDAMIAAGDANGDGLVDKAEMANAPTTMFHMADSDRDGFVDRTELAAFRAKAQSLREAM